MGRFFLGMLWGAWMVVAGIAWMLFVAGRWIAVLVGRIVRHVCRVSWQHSYRVLFGNWRRMVGTVLAGSLIFLYNFPTQQNAERIAPLWTLAFLALALWIMWRGIFQGFLSLFGGGGKNRRDNRRH